MSGEIRLGNRTCVTVTSFSVVRLLANFAKGLRLGLGSKDGTVGLIIPCRPVDERVPGGSKEAKVWKPTVG